MTTNLMPMPKSRFFTKGGAPLVGGKVYTYEAGTNNLLASYTDYSGITANTNPVILDANGEANIWLAQQQYKIVLRDANDVLQWTVDNVGQNNLADLSAGFGQATDIASATTVDLGTISTHFANITGTTTINSFGSSAALTAPIYLIKFNGALNITNSANLITRTGANITTSTNDRALVEYLGSGSWRIIDYMRADAAANVGNAVNILALANGGTGASTANAAFTNIKQAATTTATGVVELATPAEMTAFTANVVPTADIMPMAKISTTVISSGSATSGTIAIPTGMAKYIINYDNFLPVTDAVVPFMQVSVDGGSTWISSYYIQTFAAGNTTGTTSNDASTNVPLILTGNTTSNNASFSCFGVIEINNAVPTGNKGIITRGYYRRPGENMNFNGAAIPITTSAINAIRFGFNTGNIASGTITVWACK